MTYGELEPFGDRWRLRFDRTLAHAPEKVWRALTEPSQFEKWFPFEMQGELATGAQLQFVSRDAPSISFPGEMIEFRPPTVMEFRWSDNETVRLEIRPDGDGTRITLLNVFDELGKAARDAAGWHSCLDALQGALDGTAPPESPRAEWERIHAVYVEKLGAAASTVGPPADHPYAS